MNLKKITFILLLALSFFAYADNPLETLMSGCRSGNVEYIKLGLRQKINIEVQNNFTNGRSPLMEATASGQYEAVGFLLKKGANPRAKNNLKSSNEFGWTVAKYAEKAGVTRVTSLIRKAISSTGPMKGLELYSWRDRGKARYALLTGTNRFKSEKEILSSNPMHFKLVLDKLEQLAPGAWITIEGGGIRDPNKRLRLPEKRQMKKIAAACKKLFLNCLNTQ